MLNITERVSGGATIRNEQLIEEEVLSIGELSIALDRFM